MKFLITGGAGFIGSHLAEALLRRGDRVAVIDDLSTGNIENIAPLKRDGKFEYVIDAIFNRGLLAELVDGADAVFHLAAAVGVKLIVESPVRTIETNIKGTELVLEMAARKKRTVLLASMSEVYGKSSKALFRADMTWPSARPSRAGGATRLQRRCTSWRTTARRAFRSLSPGCSTPSGRARRGTTGWLSPGSSNKRWPGNR